MIVVTTPTGNIGSKLVPLLLAAKRPVRVIVRDPAKLPAAMRGQVDVVQGSSDDPKVIDRAFVGAESLFWVVPPSFQTPDIHKYYIDFSRPAVSALKKHGVKQVVSVSSLGRHAGRRAGVISASHEKDALFEDSGVAYRGLWNPSFMENMLMQLQPLKAQGTFYLPIKADLEMPHAATADIAGSAARLLLDASWTGKGGLAVMGPEDLSANDQAKIMTEVLGRPIRFQSVPGSAYKEQLLGHGASESMAQGLTEMYAAIDGGLYGVDPRTREATTPTSFRKWCEENLRAAMA